MTFPTIVAILLAVAAILGVTRLAWWQYRAPPAARSRPWRIALLLALQPILAVLLYLTLYPPGIASEAGTLVVATTGAPRLAGIAAGEGVVSLPEAKGANGQNAPDLATALRRHPGTRQVEIVGQGLEPRDRDSARGLALRFAPPALPRGLIGLDAPAPTAPGALFHVGLRFASMAGGTAELIDPAGRVVDAAPISTIGNAVLTGAARGPGTTLFAVQWRDATRAIAGRADVPLWTIASPATRLMILAGAPGPEVKYLRRWATDAGLAMTVSMAVGGGLDLGDAPASVSPATLARTDMTIIDDRAWDALSGGERAAMIAAVRGGMGLILRVTGPVSGNLRGTWRALGIDLRAGETVANVVLPPAAPTDDALRARRGPGSVDVPVDATGGRDEVPVLTRRVIPLDGVGLVPISRDAAGVVLAAWRPLGRGRVGVTTVEDSFALVTAGQGDRHAEWWSDLLSTLVRPQATTRPTIGSIAFRGDRITLCDLPAATTVIVPDGRRSRLLVDPNAGPRRCAGFWPARDGWHMTVGPDGLRMPFYVYPADALPGVRAAERRDATLLLVGDGDRRGIGPVPPRPGSPWPWFIGWLIAAGGTWWLERSRRGRAAAVTVSAA